MMKFKFSITLLLSAISFFGCDTMKSAGTVTPQNISQLYGSKWNLVELFSNGKAISIDKSNVPYLEIKENNLISGSLGCNKFTGGFKYEEDKWIVGPLASTKMMCPDMTVEDTFSKALNDVTNVQLKNGKLQMFKGSELLATLTK